MISTRIRIISAPIRIISSSTLSASAACHRLSSRRTSAARGGSGPPRQAHAQLRADPAAPRVPTSAPGRLPALQGSLAAEIRAVRTDLSSARDGLQDLSDRLHRYCARRCPRLPGLGSPLPTSAPGLGSPLPHLLRGGNWAHRCHAAPGLIACVGARRRRLPVRGWVVCVFVCAAAKLTSVTLPSARRSTTICLGATPARDRGPRCSKWCHVAACCATLQQVVL